MDIMVRPATEADRGFLFRVYAGTRDDELALVDWDDARKESFVRQQFEAQDAHYREHYPTATFDVILARGEPVGRLYIERWPKEIRIVDVSLLPEHRGRGIGGELVRRVLAE